MIGSYNMTEAKKIWRVKIAAERQAAFEKNDIALRDAQISNDPAALAAAITRRDQLRGIGDLIDAAGSIEVLKAIKIE